MATPTEEMGLSALLDCPYPSFLLSEPVIIVEAASARFRFPHRTLRGVSARENRVAQPVSTMKIGSTVIPAKAGIQGLAT